MLLVCFESRTSSTRSSSGNGAGIDVSLHKGMLPKLKLSKYILVYRSVSELYDTLLYITGNCCQTASYHTEKIL